MVLDDFTVVCFPAPFFFGRFAVVLVGSLLSGRFTLLCRRFFVAEAEGNGAGEMLTGMLLGVEFGVELGVVLGFELGVEFVDTVFWLGRPKF